MRLIYHLILPVLFLCQYSVIGISSMVVLACRTLNKPIFTLSSVYHLLGRLLKTYIPVYSTSLDKGLSTRKPIE